MNESKATVSMTLQQDGVRFMMQVSKEVADRMSVLREQNPQQWENKEMDLLYESAMSLTNSQQR